VHEASFLEAISKLKTMPILNFEIASAQSTAIGMLASVTCARKILLRSLPASNFEIETDVARTLKENKNMAINHIF
jgi:hypothetical protein